MSFLIRVGFPAGQFNGHGKGGVPEWPPSPARVAAALLAAEPNNPDVRALYGFAAPVIEAGVATVRSGLITYVAPNPEDLPGERTAKFEPWLNRVTKEAQGGVLTDQCVSYYYAEDLPSTLARAAAGVTYLGRPTSPATFEIIEDETPSHSTTSRWEPAAAGSTQINVHTPELLAALDGQHQVRTQTGDPGFNLIYARPVASYTLVSNEIAAPVNASAAEAAAALENGFYYATSSSVGTDAMVAIAVAEQMFGCALLPVFAEHERAQGQLLGVFALGIESAPACVQVPTLDRVLEFVRIDDEANSRLFRLRRYLSTSPTWTSVLPVPTQGLAQALEDFEAAVGASIVDGAVHPMPRFDLPRRIDDDSITHLSLRLDAPVRGPLFLTVGDESYPLTPFGLEG